ncbi:hypothetical protein [Vibrio sp. CAU 1672]|uniref:hypothetical protein n=1 Tax=Vibrio sp. CAU 1672 TaxID=3032594 RepID=UPI0023DCE73E|nr:hypothetical protein [Vibrio sp. CAU 1672]MDF2152790.1 hypothetical protein [Vibrio sp. CAU 1672]
MSANWKGFGCISPEQAPSDNLPLPLAATALTFFRLKNQYRLCCPRGLSMNVADKTLHNRLIGQQNILAINNLLMTLELLIYFNLVGSNREHGAGAASYQPFWSRYIA